MRDAGDDVVNPRIVVWFSCGAASAIAAKLTLERYPTERVRVVYCDLFSSEHPDNRRFMRDVANWLGVWIETIKSKEYASIDEVFVKTRYMAGIQGARCTIEMKKRPRFDWQKPDDIHVFGMTVNEHERVARLERNNPELNFHWPLVEAGYTKADCFALLTKAEIELPIMYQLGFKNNNCIGCVKATSIAYWKKVRFHFPETFARRAQQSRELGVRLTRLKGKRIFLDEIPPDDVDPVVRESISCGPECAEG